jgi:hypothetical protein
MKKRRSDPFLSYFFQRIFCHIVRQSEGFKLYFKEREVFFKRGFFLNNGKIFWLKWHYKCTVVRIIQEIFKFSGGDFL